MASVPFLGQAISRDALRYKGMGYIYGGTAAEPGDWDCSSFVSYVLGHDLRLALPGGRWGGPGMPPAVHGPVVEDYAVWTGATTVGTPAAGDLCIWVGEGPDGHIGIATSGTSMVSALNPSDGVQVTPIVGTGPAGAPLIYRRVTGLGGGANLPAVVGSTGTGAPVAAVLLFAGLAVAVLLLAAGAAAAVVWFVSSKVS